MSLVQTILQAPHFIHLNSKRWMDGFSGEIATRISVNLWLDIKNIPLLNLYYNYKLRRGNPQEFVIKNYFPF